ncbi:uncharacterized protein [Sinocyclocheilus grahami]|uniref:uncharacterized protein n=1 Tax=Sinocyclocheilus grahami TaxID=75366 RepID=UPI0007AD6767|nr:PREDICTED: uncharacterized protein LOC107575400 [Sinocyclocheilus grahami]
MGKSEKRKSRNGTQAAANANKNANETSQARKELLTENMHDYMSHDTDSAEFMLCEEEFPCLPETPGKSPAIKQRKAESADTTAILSQLGELSRLINNRSDALEKMVGENSRVIASMKETINENTRQISGVKDVIDFMSAEVKDLKVKVGATESLAKRVEFNWHEQEKRLLHLEAYSRRWSLRVHGVPESERENVRGKIIDVCQQLLPDAKDKLPDAVDTVHRLGRKRLNDSKPRGIIIQFTSRFQRDAVWRAAKDSIFLRNNNLKISEDLSQADRERRNQLWPVVEKARKENKRAYFVGGRAFVEGAEIFPPK